MPNRRAQPGSETFSSNFSQVYIYDRSRTVELNNRLVNLTAALIKANLYIYDVINRIPVQTFIETSLRLPPAVSDPPLQYFLLLCPSPPAFVFCLKWDQPVEVSSVMLSDQGPAFELP
jgi:hypothetical protein